MQIGHSRATQPSVLVPPKCSLSASGPFRTWHGHCDTRTSCEPTAGNGRQFVNMGGSYNGGTPGCHQFLDAIFPINHPFLGDPHLLKPPHRFQQPSEPIWTRWGTCLRKRSHVGANYKLRNSRVGRMQQLQVSWKSGTPRYHPNFHVIFHERNHPAMG